MDSYKFKKWILFLLLPIVFAAVGFFGMKIFLSGKGPDVAMPQKQQNASEESAVDKDLAEISKGEQSVNEQDALPVTTKATETHASTDSVTMPAEKSKTETNSEKPAEEVVQNVQMEEGLKYTFDSIDVFSLQVGSYSTLSNAEKHVETLSAEGIRAYVYSGNGFKVLVGASTSRENVASLKEELSDKIPDAFVKSITMLPEEVAYTDEQKLGSFQDLMSLYRKRLVNNLTVISNIDAYSKQELEGILKQDLNNLDEMLVKLNDSKNVFSTETEMEQVVEKMILYSENAKNQIGQCINNGSESSLVFDAYLKEILQFNRVSE